MSVSPTNEVRVAAVTAVPIEGVESSRERRSASSKSSKNSKGGSVGSSSKKNSSGNRKSSSSVEPIPEIQTKDLSGILGSVDPLADIDQNINSDAIRAYLESHHFPEGIIEIITESSIRAGPRYYVVDDSGSMQTTDGERIIFSRTREGEANHVHSTRWEELADSLKFHAGLIHASNMKATFRFLNGPRIRLPADGHKGYEKIMECFGDTPSGATPLCRHLTEIIDEIEANAASLRKHRRRAVLVIFTDGTASDGELVTVLARLQNLPAWIVLRLSTNDSDTVRYWNYIDSRLDVDMDIIDDPINEAKQIRTLNPWLCYNISLQRMREFGVTLQEVDLLDEQPLSSTQVLSFCSRILSLPIESFPDPNTHTRRFCKLIAEKQQLIRAPIIHNLYSKLPSAWFCPKQLAAFIRRTGGKSGSMCKLL